MLVLKYTLICKYLNFWRCKKTSKFCGFCDTNFSFFHHQLAIYLVPSSYAFISMPNICIYWSINNKNESSLFEQTIFIPFPILLYVRLLSVVCLLSFLLYQVSMISIHGTWNRREVEEEVEETEIENKSIE